MLLKFKNLIYPPKCALCGKVLQKNETDLCLSCRTQAPEFIGSKRKVSFVAGWTALWYYKGDVRTSIIGYKFYNNRYKANPYGRLLAMKLLRMGLNDYDMVTWVPLSLPRLLSRGFDHVRKIAIPLSRELQVPAVRTLTKPVHNLPQSAMKKDAERRANTLGVFRVWKPERFVGKRVLLLDDIITTGSTASECVKMLMAAGAKEVYFAAVAATEDHKGNR